MIEQSTEFLFLLGGCGIGLFIGFIISKVYFFQNIKKERKSAVTKSKQVTLGYVHEKLAPILPEFPYSYKDLTFIGKGIDYLVFDGLSAGSLKKIIFLEIKSKKSGLNKNERQIKQVIEKGAVTHQIMRIHS